MSRSLYLVLCVLACIAPIALVVVSIGMDEPPESDAAFAAIGLLLAAVLTYPAGVVGTVFCMIVIWAGLVTTDRSHCPVGADLRRRRLSAVVRDPAQGLWPEGSRFWICSLL